MDNLQLMEKEVQLLTNLGKGLKDIECNQVITLTTFEEEMEAFINECSV